MEGTGYWIVLALLYLFSMWAKKKQQASRRQQNEDGTGGESKPPTGPPQPDFLKNMFKEAGFDFAFDEEEEEAEQYYETEAETEVVPETEDVTIREKIEEFDRRIKAEEPELADESKKRAWADIEEVYSGPLESKSELFPELEDIEDLRAAIILKEVLDRPRAHRRRIR